MNKNRYRITKNGVGEFRVEIAEYPILHPFKLHGFYNSMADAKVAIRNLKEIHRLDQLRNEITIVADWPEFEDTTNE